MRQHLFEAVSCLNRVSGVQSHGRDICALLGHFIASLCDEEGAFEVEDAAEDSVVDWEMVPVDNYWEQLESGPGF